MTIEFLGKQLDKYERWKNKPYIGYFTPEGKLVDYNTSLGGSHGQLGNIVSWTFLLWIKQSNAFKSLGIQDFKIYAKLNNQIIITPVYILDQNIFIFNFNQVINKKSITFLLTDYNYDNLPIMKGEMLFGKNS